jgi:hypothetical protein
MIAVSNRAGLHRRACGADDFWGHDVDKQWRKIPILAFSTGCCLTATQRIRDDRQLERPFKRARRVRCKAETCEVRSTDSCPGSSWVICITDIEWTVLHAAARSDGRSSKQEISHEEP